MLRETSADALGRFFDALARRRAREIRDDWLDEAQAVLDQALMPT